MAKARENKMKKPKETRARPRVASISPEACPRSQLLESLNQAWPTDEADNHNNQQPLPDTNNNKLKTNNGDNASFKREQAHRANKRGLEVRVTPTPAHCPGYSPFQAPIPPTAPMDPHDFPAMPSSPPSEAPLSTPAPVSRRYSGKSSGNRVTKPSQKKGSSGKNLSKLSWKFREGTMGDKVSVPPPAGFVGEFGEKPLQEGQLGSKVNGLGRAPSIAPTPGAARGETTTRTAVPLDTPTAETATKAKRLGQRLWKHVRRATSIGNIQAQRSRSASPVKNTGQLPPAAEGPTVPEVQVQVEKAAKSSKAKIPQKKARDLPEPPENRQVLKAKSHGSLFSKKQHTESETKEEIRKRIQELEDELLENRQKLQELAGKEDSESHPSVNDDLPVIAPGVPDTRGHRSRRLARPSLPTIMSGQRLDQIDPEESNNRRRSQSRISEELPLPPPHRNLRRTTAQLPRQNDSRKRKAAENPDYSDKEGYDRAFAQYDRSDDADYVEDSDIGIKPEPATPIRRQPVRTAKFSKAVSVTPGARGHENVPPVPHLEGPTTRASTRKKPAEKPIAESQDELEKDDGLNECF